MFVEECGARFGDVCARLGVALASAASCRAVAEGVKGSSVGLIINNLGARFGP
jgi:hypothetical protein